MNNINIRLAKLSDKEYIKLIHKESKKEIGGFNLFYSWDKYCSKESPYLFYVVEDNGEKVGFMRFGFSKQLQYYVVKEIGIELKHRGKGYGQKFINKMPKPIYLTCNDDNLVGNQFYKSVGFTHAGKKKLKNGSISNVWILNS